VPEVIYYVATSLDAYIATPDGGVGWLAPFESADEDYGYAEFYASIDAVLLGSRTYKQSLAFSEWPYPGKPSWVFSKRRLKAAGRDVRVTARGPREVLAELKARGYRRAWLVGGGKLAASFRAKGLITEYIVSVVPVILGAGIPLFASRGPKESLTLAESKSYPNGLMQLRYRRAPA
jgi:dihydrofolate reductase